MTDRKSYPWNPVVPPWILWGYPLIKVMGPQFGETAYMSEVNRARKVKSDAKVAMSKISGPCRNIFLRGGWGDNAPTRIFPNHRNCPKRVVTRKLLFGHQVNTDKANIGYSVYCIVNKCAVARFCFRDDAWTNQKNRPNVGTINMNRRSWCGDVLIFPVPLYTIQGGSANFWDRRSPIKISELRRL